MYLIEYEESVMLQRGTYTQKARTLTDAIQLFEKAFPTRKIINITKV